MKKRHLLGKTLLIMVLFFLFTSTAVVNAQSDDVDDDHDDDGVSDDDESRNERQLQVHVTDSHVEIESKLESGGTGDAFKIEIETDLGGVQFKVQFETENATLETEDEFKVQFKELVEFIDDNGNGVYDDEVDTNVQTYELISFEPIDYKVENGTDGTVHMFNITTTDGVFSAQIYAVGEFADVNGTLVAPTQLKIDVIIRDFNYIDDSSQLALKVELEASGETSYNDETEDEEDGRSTDEAELDFMIADLNGFFSWKETAEIDGITYPVNATIDEIEGAEQELYLNYVRGNVIIHDPKVGFESLLIGVGVVPGLGEILADNFVPIAAISAIAVVGMIVVLMRRRA